MIIDVSITVDIDTTDTDIEDLREKILEELTRRKMLRIN
jgi:hypothetical protein